MTLEQTIKNAVDEAVSKQFEKILVQYKLIPIEDATNKKTESGMTMKELQVHFKRSLPTLRKLYRAGKLPGYKLGRKYLFRISEVEKALRNSK